MINWPLFFLFFALASSALGYVPKSSMILSRVADNSGSGYYQIDQEVQFPNGSETLSLKETWLIESENNMKLLVTGMRDQKDAISFFVVYSQGNRTQAGVSRRVTESFFEKYFHFRNGDHLVEALARLKLIPTTALSKKGLRSLKEIDHRPESFVRLARTGGVVNYFFGTPSEPEQETQNPGFWVEQDQFVVRKIRFPDQSEVLVEKHGSYAKGLVFPKTRTVKWGSQQVTIQTLNVIARPRESWAQFGAKATNKSDGLTNHPSAGLIEEFYRRFR